MNGVSIDVVRASRGCLHYSGEYTLAFIFLRNENMVVIKRLNLRSVERKQLFLRLDQNCKAKSETGIVGLELEFLINGLVDRSFFSGH